MHSIHALLTEALENIYHSYGVQIDSIMVDWINLSTTVKHGAEVGRIQINGKTISPIKL